MKAVFRQSHRNTRFYIICVFSLLILVSCIFTRNYISVAILFIPIILLFLRKYKITDDDLLKGNGEVPVLNIQKLVYQPDHIDIYYISTTSRKVNVKQYFPIDKKGFVDKLKEINTDIQVI